MWYCSDVEVMLFCDVVCSHRGVLFATSCGSADVEVMLFMLTSCGIAQMLR